MRRPSLDHTDEFTFALREAAKEAAVLLYAPRVNPYFEELNS